MAPLQQRPFLAQAVGERAAVGQAGQHIGVGQDIHLVAGCLQIHQHLALAVVGALELQQPDHLARQGTEQVLHLGRQLARSVVQNAQRAQHKTVGRDQRRPSVKAQRVLLGDDGVMRKTRVLGQLGTMKTPDCRMA